MGFWCIRNKKLHEGLPVPPNHALIHSIRIQIWLQLHHQNHNQLCSTTPILQFQPRPHLNRRSTLGSHKLDHLGQYHLEQTLLHGKTKEEHPLASRAPSRRACAQGLNSFSDSSKLVITDCLPNTFWLIIWRYNLYF